MFMIKYNDSLVILGTSHIAKQSLDEIKDVFLSEKPDIIAVELDGSRLNSLLNQNSKQKNVSLYEGIKMFGVKGYLFAILGKYAQKKLGMRTGINPGSDMLLGVQLARNNFLDLELIDRHIQITLKRLSKYFTWKERFRLVYDVLFGHFDKSQIVKIDLNKVPDSETIHVLLKSLKDRYPSFYNVLIHERNVFMAKKLVLIHKNNPSKKIMALVGAGHEIEILEHFKAKINTIDVFPQK